MSPEELAKKHPRLFHITRPQALPLIERHGLLSTSRLLDLFELSATERCIIEERRRPVNVVIRHALHGEAIITDNLPLSELALQKCLDDGLTPADWLRMINRRVFFWPDETRLGNHLKVSEKSGEARSVLVFDTMSLVRAHHRRVELAAINTGSTIRRPARRGLSTFSAAHLHSYSEWQKLRGGRDRVKEVTVIDGVDDIHEHLVDCYDVAHS
jgi:hypothetical protein